MTPTPISSPWLTLGVQEGAPSPACGSLRPIPQCRAPPAPGLTHKVRSLGMWLKLDTGMVVMLLLFRVLVGKPESVSVCPAGVYVGGRAGLLPDKHCPVVHPQAGPALGWTRGGAYANERETESRSGKETQPRSGKALSSGLRGWEARKSQERGRRMRGLA